MLFGRLKRFCVVNIRWITRIVMTGVVVLLGLHVFYPPSVEWVGERLHLAPPSLASVLSLVVVVWLLERVIVLQEEVRRPPVRIHKRRVRAYRELSELIKHHGAKSVDLLQVSGHTALRLLRDIAEDYPQAQVRLLLMHTATAAEFDTDQKPDHRERILTTIREVELIEEDNPGFRVTKKYYTTPPAVSGVVVDRDLVSISWYHCYKDPENPSVVRVRGHLAATVTAVGDAAEPLLSFVRDHFNKVWATAKDTYE
jgi:hypothetical protein